MLSDLHFFKVGDSPLVAGLLTLYTFRQSRKEPWSPAGAGLLTLYTFRQNRKVR